MTDDPNPSGWEKADAAANKVGNAMEKADRVANAVARPIVKVYGVVLVIIGIIVLVSAFATAWWVGLILIAYGIYLVFPGSKFVVW